jgi:peroxiredoxin
MNSKYSLIIKGGKVIFIFFLLLSFFQIFSQNNKKSTFKIMGTTNTLFGKIILSPVCDSIFYPIDLRNLYTTVKEGKFEIVGNIEYPTGFYFRFEDGVNNFEAKGILFIESGEQSITCDVQNKELVILGNDSQKEYTDKFKLNFIQVEINFKKLKHLDDSVKKANFGKTPNEFEVVYQNNRKEIYKLSDRLLFDYVKKYPDSFVGFWKLAEQLHWGHEVIYDSTFNNFSEKIKNTYSGKVLFQKLNSSLLLQVGKKFPVIDLISHKETSTKFLNTVNKKTYKLVDFWYSHCSPCIKQFPKFKKIYAEYSVKGFDILGISIDKKEDMKDWENIISKQELTWSQFWDINGIESSKLSINVFPTNFLIDENGIVVKKDISPEELSIFLKQNLKM